MLWGITRETLEPGSAGDDDDAVELRGFAASPGVVEGVGAGAAQSSTRSAQIQRGRHPRLPGDRPDLGARLQKIAAAVSDIGGSMCHAAIVAREYGLPAVVGTGIATTGSRTASASASTAAAASSPSSSDETAHDHARPRSLASRDVGLGDAATVGGKGGQPRRADRGRHRRAARLRGDDGGLPAGRRAPDRGTAADAARAGRGARPGRSRRWPRASAPRSAGARSRRRRCRPRSSTR